MRNPDEAELKDLANLARKIDILANKHGLMIARLRDACDVPRSVVLDDVQGIWVDPGSKRPLIDKAPATPALTVVDV
jgi:hypothetical protein